MAPTPIEQPLLRKIVRLPNQVQILNCKIKALLKYNDACAKAAARLQNALIECHEGETTPLSPNLSIFQSPPIEQPLLRKILILPGQVDIINCQIKAILKYHDEIAKAAIKLADALHKCE